MLVWMSADAMVPAKPICLSTPRKRCQGQIESLRYRVDVNTLASLPAPDLELNEIGRVSISLMPRSISMPIAVIARPVHLSSSIDSNNATVAAGMILDQEGDPTTPCLGR